MYVLYADNANTLKQRSQLFDQHFEPVLQRIEAAYRAGKVPANLLEIPEYLLVCRWPFRKLEYSLALDVLLNHLKPGDTYLDAGCGATPLAYILAGRGVKATAIDGNPRLIKDLIAFRPQDVYGSDVTLEHQDLTHLTYADNTFNAVSCISVVEHIPAPLDQDAIQEMLRVLKTGGLFILTLDYRPPMPTTNNGDPSSKLGYYIKRTANLVRDGKVSEVFQGLHRKLAAQQVVQAGKARHARSGNQNFEIAHLTQDIEPLLAGEFVSNSFGYSTDLHSVTSEDAYKFWQLDGIYNTANVSNVTSAGTYRPILPVAFVIKKP